MADKKISELVSLAGKDVAATDLFPVVDVSVSEIKSLTRDELRNAVNAIQFAATKALATTAAASLPDDTIIEVAADESLAGARTRYTVAAGVLVFAYGVATQAELDAASADLADASDPAKGAALVGYDGGDVQDVLDDAKPMSGYSALRAYTGRATGVRITTPGIAGLFQRDADTTTADNGGTVIVDASGRRWKRVFDGAVDPKWFGAAGDMVTDDTAPVTAAINCGALAVLFSDIFLVTTVDVAVPVRLYGPGGLMKSAVRSDALLNVTASGVEIDGLDLRGAGYGAAISATNISDTGIRVNGAGTTTQLSNIIIKNCRINGLAGFGVRIDYATNVIVDANNIQYCGYSGITGLSVINAVITRNRVDNIQSSSGAVNWYGISLTRDPTRALVDSAQSTNCAVAFNVVSNVPGWTGIDLHATYKVSVVNNHVYGCKNGIYAQYDSSSDPYKMPAEDVLIAENLVEGANSSVTALGLASLGLPGMPNKRIRILNNSTTLVGGYGNQIGAIHVRDTVNGEVRGNVCEKSLSAGISMYGACVGMEIEGNTFNGVIGVNTYWAFLDYTDGFAGCVMRRNRFVNTTGDVSYTPSFGFWYVVGGGGLVFDSNRVSALTGTAYIHKNGGSSGVYSDLRWVLESETVKFNYTTVGGTQLESIGSKSSLFRRLPDTSGTFIGTSIVSFNQPASGSYPYRVRGSFGDVYTPAVYRQDWAATTAGIVLTDITLTVSGVFWAD